MDNFLKKTIEKIKGKFEFNSEKDIDLTTAFDEMDKELENAEKMAGENFFPKDVPLTEEKDYLNLLKLPENTNFNEIRTRYEKLKLKYDTEDYINNSEKSEKIKVFLKKLDEAYDYFENKYL